jgi:hypothetical protein
LFKSIATYWNPQKKSEGIEKHPIYGPVLSSSIKLLSNSEFGLSRHWSENGKTELLNNVISDIQEQFQKPNPRRALRTRCLECFIEAARFDVLIMKPPTQHRHLSGQMGNYIAELQTKDQYLQEFLDSFTNRPTELNDVHDYILNKYWILYFHINALNIARSLGGDCPQDPKSDWFGVSYLSLCIWTEDRYRNTLGLPSSIDGENSFWKSLAHSEWVQVLEEDQENPRQIWEQRWWDKFAEPSPFSGDQV